MTRCLLGFSCSDQVSRLLIAGMLGVALSGCPSATTTSAVRQTESAQEFAPVAQQVSGSSGSAGDQAQVSEMLDSMERFQNQPMNKSFSCPNGESLWAASLSGPLSRRVAASAMGLLGHEERASFPPDGLKCAKQASTVLKQAGVNISGSAGVVELVGQLRGAGWCDSAKPIPGAVAYANNEFGNGPRSHIGVVSYVKPELENKVQNGMTPAIRSRFTYDEPNSSQSRQLTIYHNATRWIVGYPQTNYDRKWFSKVKFLVPPESCRGPGL